MAALTSLAIGLMLAGTATSVYGQVKAGKAQKKAGAAEQRAAEDQAELSEYNAAVADVQAKDATERGAVDANRFRARTRQLIGEQRAGYAASNIDVGYGSAVDVQADAAFLGELDALTVTTNAAREAWGYQVEGEDLRRQAQIQRTEGANARAAGNARGNAAYIGAIGAGIAGASGLLENKYGFGRAHK